MALYGGRERSYHKGSVSTYRRREWKRSTHIADDQSGSQVDTLLGHQSESVLVDQVAMLDPSDPPFNRIPGSFRGEAMSCDQSAALSYTSAGTSRAPLRG